MSTVRALCQAGQAKLSWLVSGFGLLSIAVFLGWAVWFRSVLDTTAIALSMVTIAAPALGLVWGGYRLERSQIGVDRYCRVVYWTTAVGLGFLAINLAMIVLFPWYSFAGDVAWAHFAVNTGAIAGFTFGFIEARAIQREVEATAVAVRAERLEDEREVLTYLNDLLRHEVLNSAQIISGHASLLLEEVGDEHRHRSSLETIDRESEGLTDVIDDVRAMLNASQTQDPTTSVDLSALVREEVQSFNERFDHLEIETTIPDDVAVSANSGVKWIVINLLENALEHNDSDRPHVTVTVTTTADTATVEVADNGPGISEETRRTLFERKSRNHGLGLYLVHILSNRYGGCVELNETSPDGSRFTVTLPRAGTDGRGANGTGEADDTDNTDVTDDTGKSASTNRSARTAAGDG
ncbi:Signal transduction histidine kinase [Natronorubrum sediminis]|uniref:histidine kinase n=1 Tax=Natronorubrum sediminis TaxID=640943 RepID=A0A1H6G3B9_9EURY|nr:HAMP domain-containing sensor histidine kinase [Natronorubrum sediminis]SEH16938.1 Signal transduction histidine kinase [Natronorubrum sediminis]